VMELVLGRWIEGPILGRFIGQVRKGRVMDIGKVKLPGLRDWD
jgi:hypothetical protein